MNSSIKLRLEKEALAIKDRLAEFELKLLSQGESIQKEIDIHLMKQEKIAKTIEYIDAIKNIEEETELEVSQIKKKLKARELKSKMARKSTLESWISDFKQGASRTHGTSTHSSYIDNIHYYQNQLSSLVSSLES